MDKKKLKEEKQENYIEQLQRVQAEFENYQKRAAKEQAEHSKYASKDLIKKLLSLTDTFEQALKNIKKEDEHSKGVQMIYQELKKILKEEGVTVMESKGEHFNPEEHEVLTKEKSEEKEGIIVEELQKGYYYKDKIIRHAKVKVSSGKKE